MVLLLSANGSGVVARIGCSKEPRLDEAPEESLLIDSCGCKEGRGRCAAEVWICKKLGAILLMDRLSPKGLRYTSRVGESYRKTIGKAELFVCGTPSSNDRVHDASG